MKGSKLVRRTVVAVLVATIASLSAAGSVPGARSAPNPGGGSAFVRVNQVGYPAGTSKRAYLMSSVNQVGAAFAVKNTSGVTVATGTAGASLGSWSQTYSFVHPLDFAGTDPVLGG